MPNLSKHELKQRVLSYMNDLDEYALLDFALDFGIVGAEECGGDKENSNNSDFDFPKFLINNGWKIDGNKFSKGEFYLYIVEMETLTVKGENGHILFQFANIPQNQLKAEMLLDAFNLP